MRAIKFRAWDKVNKKMIDTPMAICSGKGGWVLFTAECEGLDCGKAIHDIRQYEIMQFTGLKDKHEPCKEIYEGDIVQNQQPYFKGIVYFKRGSFWVREIFSHVDEGIYDGDREKETQWSIDLAYKIIGNIYETPELLERT